MPVITQSARKRKFRIQCPYANCNRRFKSRHGATYHKRTKHKPWEPLAPLDSLSDSDQSISLLHDEHSSSDDSDDSDLPNSDPFRLAIFDASEDGKQDEGGSVPPQLDVNDHAMFENNGQGGGSSPDRPHLGSDLPDPGLDTLGGNDNLTNSWTEDLDINDDEPEIQSRPSTYSRYREYHPYLTGEY